MPDLVEPLLVEEHRFGAASELNNENRAPEEIDP